MHLIQNHTTKLLLFIGGLFVCGLLAGNFWHYLGDKDNIVNRYLEAHTSRIIGDQGASQIYYVFYNDFASLSAYVDARTELKSAENSSIKQLATVNIDNASLPDSLNILRQQDFIRFVFPGTFPFICH